MSILNFESFLNESFFINESLGKKDAYLIGDSCSILMASTKELKNRVPAMEGLSVGGIGTQKFARLLENYDDTHPEVKFIFLSMGANDLYQSKNSAIIKSSIIVKKELNRIFPNAQKFVISAGSWGWGGLDRLGVSKSPPQEIFDYYDKVWKPQGFIFIPEYVGISIGRGGKASHPGLSSPGVPELARSILKIIEGKKEFYKEDIRSLRDLGALTLDNEYVLRNFYDVLQKAVHDKIRIKQTSRYSFDPVVERAQIGLRYFAYPLPRFGVDGLFGPETSESVRNYKKDQKVEGNPSEMDDYFFISLINNLKNNSFSAESIRNILDESYESIGSVSDQTQSAPVQFGTSMGGDEYLIFVQHNQGVVGAKSLVEAKFGKGPIYPFTKKKGMINNIPSDMMKEWGSQIKEALSSGDDKRAATLFLEMWKQKYASKKQRGLGLINKPEYASIKSILQKASSRTGVPFDVLVTIATIESGLKPSVGNRTYKGLFALNPSTAVKYNPAINQSTVHDPEINADAASKMIAKNKNDFISSLSKSGLISKLDLS